MDNRNLLSMKKIRYLLLSTIIISGTYSIENTSANSKNMPNPKIDHIFIKTKTICVGRFLIDVPDNASIVYGPAHVPFPIRVYKGKPPAMESMINERLLEVKKEKKFAEGPLRENDNIIGKVIDGVMPGQKIIFGVSQQSGIFYRAHSYLPHGESIFVQEVDSFSGKREYGSTVQELNVIARLLRPRGELEIPQAPGICIEDGFVTEPPQTMREYVTLGIRLIDYPDVHFSMSTTNNMNLVGSDAIEPRLKQAEENARARGLGAWYSGIKTLRRGQRELGIWRGFEILARLPVQAVESQSHEFKYLSQGESKNPYLPMLEIELRTGVKGNKVGGIEPSLSDEEAVLLWDRITGSIRLRPFTTK